jgi:predicted lipoprotein with Yx(FWY)xxD motif
VKRSVIASAASAAVAVAAALLLVAPAGAAARGPATVKVSNSSLGKILVNGSGRTLYTFTKDARSKDRCVKIQGCTSIWPPLTTKGKPIARAGAKGSLLGTIKLPNGSRQVTYAGHPLYTYSADVMPHETDYVGSPQFGGTWYAVSSTGAKVK